MLWVLLRKVVPAKTRVHQPFRRLDLDEPRCHVIVRQLVKDCYELV